MVAISFFRGASQPRIKPKSPALAGGFWKPPGKPNDILLLPKAKELKLPLSSAEPKTEAWWGQQRNTGQQSGQHQLPALSSPQHQLPAKRRAGERGRARAHRPQGRIMPGQAAHGANRHRRLQGSGSHDETDAGVSREHAHSR